jgi:hypothetical protein
MEYKHDSWCTIIEPTLITRYFFLNKRLYFVYQIKCLSCTRLKSLTSGNYPHTTEEGLLHDNHQKFVLNCIVIVIIMVLVTVPAAQLTELHSASSCGR